MGKIYPTKTDNGYNFHFICKGCNCDHAFNDTWNFNGNLDKPTVTPSILVHGWVRDYDGKSKPINCHSYITDGSIQYLSDCHHYLKGQTIELPEVDSFFDKLEIE